ncbi:hypothetical protein EYF80_001691 [Liparis tanakae]|uniref:Uncharacterized protein n=1 Tax=Liparis tanakae TaxID=230148 RepID=A0A4Z2JD71_9TELE|nr:hypothetical protein EYF80_001691 [Liparis tanakae]
MQTTSRSQAGAPGPGLGGVIGGAQGGAQGGASGGGRDMCSGERETSVRSRRQTGTRERRRGERAMERPVDARLPPTSRVVGGVRVAVLQLRRPVRDQRRGGGVLRVRQGVAQHQGLPDLRSLDPGFQLPLPGRGALQLLRDNVQRLSTARLYRRYPQHAFESVISRRCLRVSLIAHCCLHFSSIIASSISTERVCAFSASPIRLPSPSPSPSSGTRCAATSLTSSAFSAISASLFSSALCLSFSTSTQLFGHLPPEALTLPVLLLVVLSSHVKTQLQLLHLSLQLGLCLGHHHHAGCHLLAGPNTLGEKDV